MSDRILVTGAPGTVGTDLVRLTAQRGLKPRVLVHRIERSGEVSYPDVEIVEGDLADASSMARALRGIDTVFLASSATPQLMATQDAAIGFARRAGVSRIVKLSAYGADPMSSVPFFCWHGATENVLRASGVRWTLIRPYMYMQTLLLNVPSIQRDGAIFNCGAGSRIPFVDGRDVAAVCLEVLLTDRHDRATYTVTGPQALTWPDVADAVSAVISRPVRYVPVSPEGMAKALTAAGMQDWLVASLVALMKFHQSDAGTTTDAIAQLSGHEPRPLADFLIDYASAFRSDVSVRLS